MREKKTTHRNLLEQDAQGSLLQRSLGDVVLMQVVFTQRISGEWGG